MIRGVDPFHRVVRKMTTVKADKIRFLLTVAYMMLILYTTVFSRRSGGERIFKGLFWEYRNGMWSSILLNMLLFVPLGFITESRKGVVLGFLLSAAIEITQYIGVLGYCEVDDVLNNTIGAVVGYLVWRLTRRLTNKMIQDC